MSLEDVTLVHSQKYLDALAQTATDGPIGDAARRDINGQTDL